METIIGSLKPSGFKESYLDRHRADVNPQTPFSHSPSGVKEFNRLLLLF